VRLAVVGAASVNSILNSAVNSPSLITVVFKSEKIGLGINPASYSYFYTTNTQEAASIEA